MSADPQRADFPEMAARTIRRELEAGHFAVAWAALEIGGRGCGRTFVGDHVEARVAFTMNGGERVERVAPLMGVWRIPELGGTIEEVGAPSGDFLFWQAVAVGERDDGLVYVAAARDWRGLAAVPLSRVHGEGGETVGRRATRALLSTTIQGAAGRFREAAARLGETPQDPGPSLRTIAATALVECFAEPVHDGGHPLTEWIVGLDGLEGIRSLAQPLPPPASDNRRRSRLSAAVLGTLEGDVHGTGFDSPRSRWEKAAEPALDEVADPRRDARDAVNDLLALFDLVARAELSEREREVFLLRHVDDLTLKEVAQRLDLAEGTVKSLEHRARTKLRAAYGI